MARAVQARIVVTGKLIALTPLHVGGYGESFDSDLPLARDGADCFYVPGTSLAGPLRAWCLDAFGEAQAEGLWGHLDKPKQTAKETKNEEEKRKGRASLWSVQDALVENICGEALRDYETEVRDGVGINRKWGVAEDKFKYDRAILPRGSKLRFRLTVDVEDHNNPDQAKTQLADVKARLGHLLQALTDGDVPFGAAKTRGLGRLQLVADDIRLEERNTRNGLLESLASGGKVASITQLISANPSVVPKQPETLTVSIHWKPRGSLMIKSGSDGIGVDMMPLVSGKDGGVALVLSGSSTKGALRSHAERIARTVRGQCLVGEETFEQQMGHIPLITDMFGMGKPPKGNIDGNIGALAVSDCYAEKFLSRERWQKVATAKDSDLQNELNIIRNDGIGAFEQMHHVAIDRWTGGAAESMLFSTLEPYDLSWEPIVLRLELDPRRNATEQTRKNWDERDAALALLFLVLRDLVAGRVPLGFAVNRGPGEIVVTSIQFDGRNLKDQLSNLNHKKVDLKQGDNFFQNLGEQNLLQILDAKWKKWLAE